MVSMPHSPGPTSTGLVKPLLAGGLMLVIVGLIQNVGGVRQWLVTNQPSQPQDCEAIIHSDARLSREQLASLLTIPERDPKDAVRKIVSEPYCRLPQLQVRSGVVAEREAYPLAFDPNTQLVILYENDEYAGYRFRFQ
ncbi:MAG: hypothetical protein HC929_10685 [Leptolyngbyaceae cyanobacterium SM2_5_2]|nr:hypothetical protein [Leptolyngbyaceae cyanobacterium SM2_5_2]